MKHMAHPRREKKKNDSRWAEKKKEEKEKGDGGREGRSHLPPIR